MIPYAHRTKEVRKFPSSAHATSIVLTNLICLEMTVLIPAWKGYAICKYIETGAYKILKWSTVRDICVSLKVTKCTVTSSCVYAATYGCVYTVAHSYVIKCGYTKYMSNKNSSSKLNQIALNNITGKTNYEKDIEAHIVRNGCVDMLSLIHI